MIILINYVKNLKNNKMEKIKYSFDILNNFIGYGSLQAEYVFLGLEEKYQTIEDEFDKELNIKLLEISKQKLYKSSSKYYSLEEDDFKDLFSNKCIKKLFEYKANNSVFYKRILNYYKSYILKPKLINHNLNEHEIENNLKEITTFDLGSNKILELLIGNIFPIPREYHIADVPQFYMEYFDADKKTLYNYKDSDYFKKRSEILKVYFLHNLNGINKKIIVFGEKKSVYEYLTNHSFFKINEDNHCKFDDSIKDINNCRNIYYFSKNENYSIALCDHPRAGLKDENIEIIINKLNGR